MKAFFSTLFQLLLTALVATGLTYGVFGSTTWLGNVTLFWLWVNAIATAGFVLSGGKFGLYPLPALVVRLVTGLSVTFILAAGGHFATAAAVLIGLVFFAAVQYQAAVTVAITRTVDALMKDALKRRAEYQAKAREAEKEAKSASVAAEADKADAPIGPSLVVASNGSIN